MGWLFWIIIFWLAFTLGVTGPLLSIFTNSTGFEYLNPLLIYKHYNVNWFGAMCLCILFHLLAPVYAIMYWFYKLCTVGRE